MNTRKPRKPSGRAAFDERGNATWEWHNETGRFARDIDTQRLKALGADLSCDAHPGQAGEPLDDPYNRSTLPASGELRSNRRTLDDLRRLSEQIKAARASKHRK